MSFQAKMVGRANFLATLSGANVATLLAAIHPWASLGKIEPYPVMPVDDVMKFLAKK